MIDLHRLGRWMDDQGLPGQGEPIEHRFLSGGTQNDIYEISRGELRCAMRIPPPSAPAGRDEGIRREWRIIEALTGTDVPHAEAVAVCPDPSVLGRAFYLMGLVDGWSPMDQPGWPAPFDADLAARQALAYQMAEGIARLSAVDWRARGLHDLGRPDGFHERQVDRWTAFLERIKGRELPGFDVAAWLRAHRPLNYVPGLMHGDYQLANVMFRHGGPARLAAIVDWEMGTVGDPKLDLAWMVQSWPDEVTSAATAFPGYADLSAMPPGPRWWPATPRCPVGRSTTSTTTSSWPGGSLPWSSSRASSGPVTTRSCRRSARSCSSSCGGPPSWPRAPVTGRDPAGWPAAPWPRPAPFNTTAAVPVHAVRPGRPVDWPMP